MCRLRYGHGSDGAASEHFDMSNAVEFVFLGRSYPNNKALLSLQQLLRVSAKCSLIIIIVIRLKFANAAVYDGSCVCVFVCRETLVKRSDTMFRCLLCPIHAPATNAK